jgi:hypothetical protein
MAAATVAAALFSATCVAVSAEAIPAPIVVTSVNAHPADSVGSIVLSPGSIDVDFLNTSNIVATKILFDVYVDNRYTTSITAEGTFSPNVAIDARLGDTFRSANQRVVVSKVRFSDGTTWTNPAPIDTPRADAW